MSLKIKNKKNLMSLTFSEEMTIYTAQEYRTTILKKFSAKKNMEVDLADVEEMDASGLQLLASISKELENNGATMNIIAMSDVASDAIEMSRLKNDLNCDQEES